MKPAKLLGIGLAGTGIAAVCCLTPALAVLLGTLGLSAALVWADYLLLPALVLFAGMSVWALLRLRSGVSADLCCRPTDRENR